MNVIGVDLGGTKVKAGLFTQEIQLLHSIERPLKHQEIMSQLNEMIQELIDYSPKKISGIGVGTAGRVKAGKITFATSNLPNWTGTDVKGSLERHFHLPVEVDNDANTAAVAEGKIGAAAGFLNYGCLTIGTGVGSGIVVNGEIQSGVAGGAGEIGHMILVPGGLPCNCGQRGCLEQYVSGTAFQRLIGEHQSELAPIATPQQLFEAASNGNAAAKKIVNQFVHYLTVGIINLQAVLELECIVIGGGIIHSEKHWWPQFIHTISQEYILKCEVKQAVLKNDAGMTGAAVMVRRKTS